MKCKQCESVLAGRQREFCSDKCRKRASRTESKPEDGPGSTNADNSERGHPHRPAIPGDQDYVGCCKQVDGECKEVMRRRGMLSTRAGRIGDWIQTGTA